MPPLRQLFQEGFPAAEAHPFAEAVNLVFTFRDCVGLDIVHLLETVFKRPQKNIVLKQMVKILVAYKPLLQETVKGTESAPLPDQHFFPAVNKLEYLYEKLYFPYASVAPLYVTSQRGTS